ncbi:MAG TPA: hypothetical protein VF384_18555 [Planctomycetota bacterium]
MSATGHPQPPLGLALEFSVAERSAIVHREEVSRADLGDLFAEIVWAMHTTHGRRCNHLFTLAVRSGGLAACGTLVVIATAGRLRQEFEFEIEALAPVVARGMQRVRASEPHDTGPEVRCRIVLASGRERVDAEGLLASGPPELRVVDTTRTKAVREALAACRAAEQESAAMPVLFRAGAREFAERCSRAGQDLPEPVETGGLLLGHLLRCPSEGVFLLIEDVLPAADAAATKYSLEYSPATWQRIGAVLRARRALSPSLRPIGQAHGHNFRPEGPPCAECARRAACTTSTAFLSASDRQWCRAVFPQSPFQVGLVFGWNARGERDAAFYGWHRGSLRLRGYEVIPDEDAAELLGARPTTTQQRTTSP